MVQGETAHGFSADRDPALLTFRARRSARRCFSSPGHARFFSVLSVACWMKGAVSHTSGFGQDPRSRAPAHAPAHNQADIISSAISISERSRGRQPDSFRRGWENLRPEQLASELQQGHSVFIDFTAEWCITCKFNESTVLETAAVQAAFSSGKLLN